MSFDVQGALQVGYSKEEIISFLAKDNNFDLPSARKYYNDDEIIDFLGNPPTSTPSQIEVLPPEKDKPYYPSIHPLTAGMESVLGTRGELPSGYTLPTEKPLPVSMKPSVFDTPSEKALKFSMRNIVRPIVRGLDVATAGIPYGAIGADILPPETPAEAGISAFTNLAGFLWGAPYRGAKAITKGLMPTQKGIRGVLQGIGHSGATLGLASGISEVIPAFKQEKDIPSALKRIHESTAVGGIIGLLFPVSGLIPTKPLRIAVGMAVMDLIRGKGEFTIDDVYKGLRDGTMNPAELTERGMGYLMDMYFLGKTPSMGKQWDILKRTFPDMPTPKQAGNALKQIGYDPKAMPKKEPDFVAGPEGIPPEVEPPPVAPIPSPEAVIGAKMAKVEVTPPPTPKVEGKPSPESAGKPMEGFKSLTEFKDGDIVTLETGKQVELKSIGRSTTGEALWARIHPLETKTVSIKGKDIQVRPKAIDISPDAMGKIVTEPKPTEAPIAKNKLTPPKVEKGIDAVTYIKRRGGINYNKETTGGYSGELRDAIERNPRLQFLVNKKGTGLSLDMAREALAEEGYISPEATLDDALIALVENRRHPIYYEEAGLQKQIKEYEEAKGKVPKTQGKGVMVDPNSLQDGQKVRINDEVFTKRIDKRKGQIVLENDITLRFDPFDMPIKVDEILPIAEKGIKKGQLASNVLTDIKSATEEEFIKSYTKVFRGGSDAIDVTRGKDRGISVAIDREVAERFTAPEGGIINEIYLSPDAKILQENQIPKELLNPYISALKKLETYAITASDVGFNSLQKIVFDKEREITNYARGKGFDVVNFPLEEELRIINSNVLKTKSQLIDLYNQASILTPPGVKEKVVKPSEVQLPLGAEKTALEGKLPAKETPETPLERATEEAKTRQVEAETAKRQTDITLEAGGLQSAYEAITKGLKGNPLKNLLDGIDRRVEGVYKTDEPLIEGIEKLGFKGKKSKIEIMKQADEIAGVISDRLGNIAPELKTKIKYHAATEAITIMDDLVKVKEFTKSGSKLHKDIQFKATELLNNGQWVEAEKLLSKHNARGEMNTIRTLLDNIHKEAKANGIPIPYRKDYCPRSLNNYEGLMETYGSEVKGKIDEAINVLEAELGEGLSATAKGAVVDKMLRGFGSAKIWLGDPKFAKARSIEILTPEEVQFYDPYWKALENYIVTMRTAIARNKFFGKGNYPTKKGGTLKTLLGEDYEESVVLASKSGMAQSVGTLINQLKDKGIKIDYKKELEIKSILHAYFYPTIASKAIQLTKGIIYSATILNPIAALTQFKDLGITEGLYGVKTTVKNMGKVAIRKNLYKMVDIGVESAKADFERQGIARFFTDFQSKISGFTTADIFGKETNMNSAMDTVKMRLLKGDPELQKELKLIFGEDADLVIQDITEGRKSLNTRILAHMQLSISHPISRAEVPQRLLEGRGLTKLMYTLRTYQLKQLGVFRDKAYNQIKQGNVVEGTKNFIKLSMALLIMGVAVDKLKDFLVGRSQESISESALDNLLQMWLVNRYNFETARREGVGSAIWTQAQPAILGIVDSIFKDSTTALFGTDKQKEEPSKGLRSTRYLPLVGKILYEHWGRGAELEKKRERTKYHKDIAEARVAGNKQQVWTLRQEAQKEEIELSEQSIAYYEKIHRAGKK